jgi:phenylacetate-CoA ligase
MLPARRILARSAPPTDSMPQYYDSLEARDPEERERLLMTALSGQIAHAKRRAPGWARILAEVDPAGVTSRAALAKLPVTRKSDLAELQKAEPPLGGLNATLAQLGKIFVSPGPIYEPEGRGRDWWRTARALFAAGFRPGDVAINTFAYHFTPAGSMLESGALALGCTLVPTGTGQSEMQAGTLADLRASAYIGTPSFLKLIVEKADELKADIRSLIKAAVGAEYLPSALRAAMAERGIRVLQSYASADLGLIAYESEALEGMILDEALILEIVRPGTGEPVAEGEVGEVVITSFNPDYPLIRFGTGDLSAVLPGISPCGRTNTRIRGWMGRADQTTKVKGMFVQPSQVAEIVRRHKEILRARLVVDNPGGTDRMTLQCEIRDAPPAGLAQAIKDSIRSITKLRGEVAFRKPGELPNDGRVIEDAKKYE